MAILCSPQQHQNISVWRRDAGGRLITLLLTSFVFFFSIVILDLHPDLPNGKEDLFSSPKTLLVSKFTINPGQ